MLMLTRLSNFGLFCCLFWLGGCVGSPFSATDITLVRDSDEMVIVPGILPSAVAKKTREITVFSIHGIGNTSACYADPILAMFAGERDRTTREDEEGCIPNNAVQMPVCLASSYDITGEAFRDLQNGESPVVIGEECESAGGEIDILEGVELGVEEIRPRRVARMGTLFRYESEISYVDDLGKTFFLNATSYAYWWHGDANAIQAPFVAKDLSRERESERVAVNRALKKLVLNEGLIDATFFLGKGGVLLREGTQSALCRMVLDVERLRAPAEIVDNPCRALSNRTTFPALRDSQVVLLTQSLGSRILLDSLSGFFTDSETSPAQTERKARGIRDTILQSGPLVYMSANQLPLLGAAEVTVTDRRVFRERQEAQAAEEQDFLSQLEEKTVVRTMVVGEDELPQPEAVEALDNQEPENVAAAEPAKLMMMLQEAAKPVEDVSPVAFYDPNDLLGYPAGDHLPDERQSKYIDIQQRYAIPWFFFANPAKAHDKSFNRNRARRMILCGALQKTKGRRTLVMNQDCRR